MPADDTRRELLRGVEGHYGDSGGLAERILGHLADRGIDPARTPFGEIPAHDELHLRGRAASLELARLGEVTGPTRVLDVGSGLGGSARLLAARHGCQVVGVDLTAEFCRSAVVLSDAHRLGDRTRFVRADATRLPFADREFPIVWTQHTQMNVEDKRAFYGEAIRVLAPGGRLLFHDIFATGGQPPDFPLPWAPRPELSHLVEAERVAGFLGDRRLVRVEWRDRTLATIGWLRERLDDTESGLMMREARAEKLGNVLRALEEGRLQVVQARFDAPPGD